MKQENIDNQAPISISHLQREAKKRADYIQRIKAYLTSDGRGVKAPKRLEPNIA